MTFQVSDAYVHHLSESTHLPLDKIAAILTGDIFSYLFVNENDRILIQVISEESTDNKPALVQVMAWRRPGDKPLPGLVTT